jgi:hypothetical protein
MAKRDPQPSASTRSRQRGKPVQVQAKRPWGFIAGATVLGLLLIGVIGYAAANQGSGFENPVARADKQVKGVTVADPAPARGHAETPQAYPGTPETPPNGGNHSGVPQVCRVYDQPVPSEHAVHSLEHGAAWITYRPDLPAAQIATLREMAEGDPYILMSPFPGQKAPVGLTAWGRSLALESASDERVEQFIDVYKNGPQTPEKGATCTVGNSTTGAFAGAPPVAPASPGATPGAGSPAPAASASAASR